MRLAKYFATLGRCFECFITRPFFFVVIVVVLHKPHFRRIYADAKNITSQQESRHVGLIRSDVPEPRMEAKTQVTSLLLLLL